ncbi:unnamed protein product [Penicillium olsonii]|nr:unnamed protein product [Penicillium olsonii]
MRICVFQSSFEELQASVGDSQELCMNPGQHITQHEITHKTIHKETARAQIDEAVSEGHDFYLNLMWGTHDDSLAGVDAIRYFESLNLPAAGIQSSEREQSKQDFLATAKAAGQPRIPGTTEFPLFVKPASSYGSMFIDEHSLCQNEDELSSCIKKMNRQMRPVRVLRAQAVGNPDPDLYADTLEAAGRHSSDLVVQEFIGGEEYSVVVIAMGETPWPLNPQHAKYKQEDGKAPFLTLDLKFDEESCYELLNESDDPELWQHLQETAVQAFTTNKMHTNYMGCDVDMRIGLDGKAYVIEVDPLPVFFYPMGSQLEDTDVQRSFPGSYRAVLNTYITNYFLKNPDRRGLNRDELDGQSESVFRNGNGQAMTIQEMSEIAMLRSYRGTLLDIGRRDGGIARLLQSIPQNEITTLTGVDISSEDTQTCQEDTPYAHAHHMKLEVYLSQMTEPVDHIICNLTVQYLPIEGLDFALARFFQLARKSITMVVSQKVLVSGSVRGPLNEIRESIKTFQIPSDWTIAPRDGSDGLEWLFSFERKLR